MNRHLTRISLLVLGLATVSPAGEWVPTRLQAKQAKYTARHASDGPAVSQQEWLQPITARQESLDNVTPQKQDVVAEESEIVQTGLEVEDSKPDSDKSTDADTPDVPPATDDGTGDADAAAKKVPPTTDSAKTDATDKSIELEFEEKVLGPFFRNSQSTFTWIPRGSDKNGIGQVSFESGPTWDLDFKSASGIDVDATLGGGIHFLSGPGRSDLPPRVFDFFVNTRAVMSLGGEAGVEASFNLGVHSDFETGSEGWRYPGRLLGYIGEPDSRFVFGIEYFDLENLKILPAAGLIIGTDDTKWELYFPRVRVKHRSSDDDTSSSWNYLTFEYHGDEWAIQRSSGRSDVTTLTEYRLAIGSEDISKTSGNAYFSEIGWYFGRDLEYRSGLGSFQPHDAFMWRFGSRF